jgi:TatD DNase family protein
VGEIGLDFYRNLSPPSVQIEAFDRQLELAAEVGKPVLVHDRDAHQVIEQRLTAWVGRWPHSAPPGVLHCFSGDESLATTLATQGFLVSFALPVAFKSAVGPQRAARALAPDQILIETDAPWLGLGPDSRNEPRNVARVAVEIARLRGVEVGRVVAGTGATLARLLREEPAAIGP